jgi:ubiquitin C-terminal hydrolase
MRVTGLPDSGFLVAYDGEGKEKGPIKKKGAGWDALCQTEYIMIVSLHHHFTISRLFCLLGACNYQKSMIDTFSLMNVSSSIPQGCLDEFGPTGE